MTDPEIVVADEPTGDLDAKNAVEILVAAARPRARVRQDRRDGDARPARRGLRRRDPPPRQGRAASTRSPAAPRGRRMKFLPFIWRQPHAQQAAHRADRRRDRARDRARLPAADDAGGHEPRCWRTSRRTRASWCTTRPGSSTRCPTPTSRRSARCRAWWRPRAGPGSAASSSVEKGVDLPELRGRARADRRRLGGLEDRPEAARGLPALPRRRDRRARHAREVRLEDRRPGHAEGHASTRSTSPSGSSARSRTSARRTSGSSASTSTRRCARAARSGLDVARHDLGARRRPRARRAADARDRRHVPQQRGGDRLRDREELLQELLHACSRASSS